MNDELGRPWPTLSTEASTIADDHFDPCEHELRPLEIMRSDDGRVRLYSQEDFNDLLVVDYEEVRAYDSGDTRSWNDEFDSWGELVWMNMDLHHNTRTVVVQSVIANVFPYSRPWDGSRGHTLELATGSNLVTGWIWDACKEHHGNTVDRNVELGLLHVKR